MENADMRTVGPAFPKLQVVGLHVDTEHEPVLRLRVHERVATEDRCLLVLRNERGPDQTTLLAHRMAWLLQALPQPRIGIIGSFLNGAVGAELPSVIQTTDSTILDPPQRERRATMHAVFLEHADVAGGVTEHDQLLAE